MTNNQHFLSYLKNKKAIIKKIRNTNLYQVTFKKNSRLFIGGYSELISYNIGLIISNKNFTRQILTDNGLSIAEGSFFYPNELVKAYKYAKSIKFPVIIRQENAQKIYKAIIVKEDYEFKTSFNKLTKLNEVILIEKVFMGDSFRIIFTENGYLTVMTKQQTSNKTLNFSSIYLNKDSIKSDQQYAQHSYKANGNFHHSIFNISRKVLDSFPGSKYVIYSMIAKDITKALSSTNHIVYELYPSFMPFLEEAMINKNNQEKSIKEIFVDLLFQ